MEVCGAKPRATAHFPPAHRRRDRLGGRRLGDFFRENAHAVRRRAEEADTAAAGCWAALLGGCDPPERRALPGQLSALAEATARYVGSGWWAERGSGYRRRVAEAQLRINDAVREGDGAEFAEAFVGYDQAVATAVMSVRREFGKNRPMKAANQ